jgi:hypothetical protein
VDGADGTQCCRSGFRFPGGPAIHTRTTPLAERSGQTGTAPLRDMPSAPPSVGYLRNQRYEHELDSGRE